ncbi:hypothetical protein QFZ41_000386 [Luteibacter sp. W1I16]
MASSERWKASLDHRKPSFASGEVEGSRASPLPTRVRQLPHSFLAVRYMGLFAARLSARAICWATAWATLESGSSSGCSLRQVAAASV